MVSEKQKEAASKNIKKAQKKWESTSKRERSIAQPDGRKREKPGARGEGDFYRVVVRDKSQFTSFRNHDVGEKGGIQRLAGHRESGSWDTQAWLISKNDAHRSNGNLVADTDDAKEVLDRLESKPEHIKGDIFQVKRRRDVPEDEKPTDAQKRARHENIKKAQEARWE